DIVSDGSTDGYRRIGGQCRIIRRTVDCYRQGRGIRERRGTGGVGITGSTVRVETPDSIKIFAAAGQPHIGISRDVGSKRGEKRKIHTVGGSFELKAIFGRGGIGPTEVDLICRSRRG